MEREEYWPDQAHGQDGATVEAALPRQFHQGVHGGMRHISNASQELSAVDQRGGEDAARRGHEQRFLVAAVERRHHAAESQLQLLHHAEILGAQRLPLLLPLLLPRGLHRLIPLPLLRFHSRFHLHCRCCPRFLLPCGEPYPGTAPVLRHRG